MSDSDNTATPIGLRQGGEVVGRQSLPAPSPAHVARVVG
jgi:hypothetical protein